MPKRGYDDDHEMRDDRGGKSFRDDGGQRRYSGGNEPRGPSDPHRAYFERHKHEEWMLKGYDPKTIERALKKRALEAQQALERFVSHCQGHALEAPAQFFEDWGRAAMDTARTTTTSEDGGAPLAGGCRTLPAQNGTKTSKQKRTHLFFSPRGSPAPSHRR